MAVITIQNPRVSASADLQLEDGTLLTVTVPRDASELQILTEVRNQVQAESARRSATGQAGIRIPTDEELVPALAVFGRLAGTPRTVDA